MPKKPTTEFPEQAPDSSDDSGIEFGGYTYFVRTTQATGTQVWREDEDGNVERVSNIAGGKNGAVTSDLVVGGDYLYYTGGRQGANDKLYRIDLNGTPENAKDLLPDGAPGEPVLLNPKGETGGSIYLAMNVPTEPAQHYEIASDGAITRLSDSPMGGTGDYAWDDHFVIGDTLFGQYNQTLEPYRPVYAFTADGQAQSTTATFNPGDADDFVVTEYAAYYGDAANGPWGPDSDIEPARLTEDGTVDRLADLRPGTESSLPADFRIEDDRVYFTASPAQGIEQDYYVEDLPPDESPPVIEVPAGEQIVSMTSESSATSEDALIL